MLTVNLEPDTRRGTMDIGRTVLPPAAITRVIASEQTRRRFATFVRGVAEGTVKHGMLAKGDRVGRYETQELIGEGGFSRVYRARHVYLDLEVAIKTLATAETRARSMFLREAQSLARLRHPNVVRILDADIMGGVACIVLEARLRPRRLDHEALLRDVWDQCVQEMRAATFVIADLSPVVAGAPNPNVVTEAAHARAIGKLLVVVTRSGAEELPFDWRQVQVMKYEATADGLASFMPRLKHYIQSLLGHARTQSRH